jgi:hypothetical protein
VVVGPFRVTSGQDPKNPTRVIARIVERDIVGRTGSSIFSLPDRDYYFQEDEKSKQIRAAFLQHSAKLLELTGTSPEDAIAQAQTILNFEKTIAESVMTTIFRKGNITFPYETLCSKLRSHVEIWSLDAIDSLTCAALALIDLGFLSYLRWRRGRQGRIERRICRCLRISWRQTLAQ